MKKLRIAVIVRSLKIGGMERVAIDLVKAFAKEGCDAHLVYFKKKREYFDTQGIQTHRFDLDAMMKRNPIGAFYEIALRLLNVFLRKSYPYFKGFYTARLFQKRLQKLEMQTGTFDLLIVRGQGTLELIHAFDDTRIVFVSENIFSYGTINKTAANRIIKAFYADRNVVGVSQGVVENLRALSDREGFSYKKLCKITNAIDIESIREKAREPIDIDAPYIVSVGRLVPAKNVALAIEAFAYIKRKYAIKHRFVIVGDGDRRASLEQLAKRLGVAADIDFVGSRQNPYKWLKNASLFVLSSRFEGLGMVIVEALACETIPVVTRSEGGAGEIMQGALAPLFCEADKEILGETIYTQLHHPISIDFQAHIAPFLPHNITQAYRKEFL